ncbi:MAG: arginine--tRNA ligase [Actinomycetota bacterium]
MITDELAELVRSALEAASADEIIDSASQEINFERPRNRDHGDWSTNVALAAGRGRGNPRAIAEAISSRLPSSDLLQKVEVAGPGFLNFYLSPVWLHDVVRRAFDPGSGFGRAPDKSGTHVNVEYVSANPTGPINVVSGRHAAVGDAIANLLEARGHTVTREFYVNDAGRQVDLFAESVAVRYLQHFGHEAELPEDGYQGDYISELAKEIAQEIGDSLVEARGRDRLERIRGLALDRMLTGMRLSLERFGTRHDVWFSEKTLHDSGAVGKVVARLEEAGLVDERDGAKWLRTSALGDDKDRVLIRASGEPTYLAGDLPYLQDKFSRGHEHLIYLWGADHHGTIARLLAGAEALGYARDAVEIRLVQIVTLLTGGESVKASKRAGRIVPLDDLVDEVGADAARYIFLTRSFESPIDFDIDLAKEQAPENPVYYVQYAHARICSILRRAEEAGESIDAEAPLDALAHPSEDALMRKLASFEEVVPDAADMRAPQKITRYIEELASVFSSFYRDCKVISDDPSLTRARLVLCVAAKNVIANGLSLLGVRAPERM